MKCSNPNCNRGIGLVSYRRGWFGKQRYCSRNCRGAFATDLCSGEDCPKSDMPEVLCVKISIRECISCVCRLPDNVA
jgi:hypothetical protein